MDKSSKDNLVGDIENRLDDFFEGEAGTAPSSASNNRLEKLKSVVLAIDWEITDSCLADLIGETNTLVPQFESDRLIQTLLKMLNSLGRYIQKHKASAHPDAIKRIMSVFASLEELNKSQIDPKEKERILAKEIVAFKSLKQKIEPQVNKSGQSATKAQAKTKIDINDPSKFEKAVSEMEKRLTSEVQKLKEQLTTLQKEFDILRKG